MGSSKAVGIFGAIKPLFYFAWFLYPGAYLMPALMTLGVADYEFVVVAQQLTYTTADVLSKVIYGAMLNQASTVLSEEQGFQEAA